MTLNELSDVTVSLAGGWLPGTASSEYFPIESDHVDRHQAEMVEAFSRGASCILNANPTGGGKTLSWAAPVIRRDLSDAPDLVMATYPTAALLEDQRETLLSLLASYFDSDRQPHVNATPFELQHEVSESNRVVTDGERTFPLNQLVQVVSATFDPTTSSTEQIHRAMGTLTSLDRAGLPSIVLTTPDTLTLLATNRFYDSDVDRLVQLLDAIVVDEFHLATDRARRLLPFHLDHYRSLSARYLDSFVFLSATPHPSYVDRLDRVFDPVRVTDEIHSGPGSTESTRQILPEMRLGITTRQRFTNGRWLADNVGALEALYEPPGQLLVIVDSVREVEEVTEAFEANTDLSVGRVYGWKREGRQETIENSDVVVGNTAVEVGVDFQDVNRLVCTGYEPASVLQRIGRMRYRSYLDDFETLLVTSATMHQSIVDNASEGWLTRSEFDSTLHEPIEISERPYYDVLCAAYTRYLWESVENPLNQTYVDKEPKYRDVAAEHFAADLERFTAGSKDPNEFWERIGDLLGSEQIEPLLEELHSYRSSSLTCVVVDADDPEERLKTYSLSHVLRYRRGHVIDIDDVEETYRDVWDEPLTESEQAMLKRSRKYSVAGFRSNGRRKTPRGYYISDFAGLEKLRAIASNEPARAIRILPNPSVRTDPVVPGLEEIDLSDEAVLAQYVREEPERARQRYSLGPYAAVVPTRGDGSFLFWDDAIKAHCDLVQRDHARGG